MTRDPHGMVLALLVGAALAIAGCGRPPDVAQSDPLMDLFRRQAQEEGLTQIETEGKRQFIQYCATCHGETGAGDGQNAYTLEPPPPNFHESLAAHPSSYWRQIVEAGSAAVGRSPLCPPWGRTLDQEDINALMAYLQVLATPPEPAAALENTSMTRPPALLVSRDVPLLGRPADQAARTVAVIE